jgi:hypothetical protein
MSPRSVGKAAEKKGMLEVSDAALNITEMIEHNKPKYQM